MGDFDHGNQVVELGGVAQEDIVTDLCLGEMLSKPQCIACMNKATGPFRASEVGFSAVPIGQYCRQSNS